MVVAIAPDQPNKHVYELKLLGGTGKRVWAHADSIEAYYDIGNLWDPVEAGQDTDNLVDTGDADADDEDYKVEGIDICEERGNVQRGTKQFLVKWVGYDEPSWNDAEALYGCETLIRKWHRNQERDKQASRAPRRNPTRTARTGAVLAQDHNNSPELIQGDLLDIADDSGLSEICRLAGVRVEEVAYVHAS